MRWVLAIALWLWPLTASAHPLVDRGVREYEQAEFERALRSLDRAERAQNLSRADLVALYRCRALVHAALESDEAMEADLLRFASLEPASDLSEAPPRVRRVFERVRERVREPISLRLEVTTAGQGLRFSVEIANDVAALAREVRLRVKDGGQWRDAEGNELTILDARDDEVIEYYAEAIGPGRAVLVSEGARERPRRITRGEVIAQQNEIRTATSVRTVSSGTGPVIDDDGEDSPAVWWILGGVGAAVVVAGVIAIVLVATPNDETELAAPIGDFP